MKMSYRFNKYEQVEATMTITMTVGEWVGLSKQIESKYPGWKLTDAISLLVCNAKREFEQEINAV